MSGFSYDFIAAKLKNIKATWCVTGAAGFIGSHLVEALLLADQKVIGFDNFYNGKQENLESVKSIVGNNCWSRFTFIEGDIRDSKKIDAALIGVDYCLHQAALGSVPRSMAEPELYHDNNVVGTQNVFAAAAKGKVKSLVFASSSSVYGDNTEQPKVEERIGRALSPYALSKQLNELHADLCVKSHPISITGLRYFNVFGPRQDPNGDYAAVIPRWVTTLLKGQPCTIYGDGSTSRDFCPVPNVVFANILAAISKQNDFKVFNVGLGRSTSLNDLYSMIKKNVISNLPADQRQNLEILTPEYSDFRIGDIKHSCASINLISERLGYRQSISVEDALKVTVQYLA